MLVRPRAIVIFLNTTLAPDRRIVVGASFSVEPIPFCVLS